MMMKEMYRAYACLLGWSSSSSGHLYAACMHACPCLSHSLTLTLCHLLLSSKTQLNYIIITSQSVPSPSTDIPQLPPTKSHCDPARTTRTPCILNQTHSSRVANTAHKQVARQPLHCISHLPLDIIHSKGHTHSCSLSPSRIGLDWILLKHGYQSIRSSATSVATRLLPDHHPPLPHQQLASTWAL